MSKFRPGQKVTWRQNGTQQEGIVLLAPISPNLVSHLVVVTTPSKTDRYTSQYGETCFAWVADSVMSLMDDEDDRIRPGEEVTYRFGGLDLRGRLVTKADGTKTASEVNTLVTVENPEGFPGGAMPIEYDTFMGKFPCVWVAHKDLKRAVKVDNAKQEINTTTTKTAVQKVGDMIKVTCDLPGDKPKKDPRLGRPCTPIAGPFLCSKSSYKVMGILPADDKNGLTKEHLIIMNENSKEVFAACVFDWKVEIRPYTDAGWTVSSHIDAGNKKADWCVVDGEGKVLAKGIPTEKLAHTIARIPELLEVVRGVGTDIAYSWLLSKAKEVVSHINSIKES